MKQNEEELLYQSRPILDTKMKNCSMGPPLLQKWRRIVLPSLIKKVVKFENYANCKTNPRFVFNALLTLSSLTFTGGGGSGPVRHGGLTAAVLNQKWRIALPELLYSKNKELLYEASYEAELRRTALPELLYSKSEEELPYQASSKNKI